MDPALLRGASRGTAGSAGFDVTPKRGRALNELTKYRYDAVLAGRTPTRPRSRLVVARLARQEGLSPFEALRRLPGRRRALGALGLKPDARNATTAARPSCGCRWPPTEERAERSPRAAWIRRTCGRLGAELGYRVDISWAAGRRRGPSTWPARRRPRPGGGPGSLPACPAATPSLRELRERPLGGHAGPGHWSVELRAYLQERLPEYMVPSAFVLLERCR